MYGKTTQSYQTIPQIRFEGQWLKALGFSAGDKIRLECEENRITITKLSDESGKQLRGKAIHKIGCPSFLFVIFSKTFLIVCHLGLPVRSNYKGKNSKHRD